MVRQSQSQVFEEHGVELAVPVLTGVDEDVIDGSLFTDEVVTFAVNGAEPAIVDMTTFWVHSITNTGTEPLVTLFFADEPYDPENPDTYPEDV